MCIPTCQAGTPPTALSLFAVTSATGSPHICRCIGQRACEEVAAIAQRDDRVGRVGREEPDVALRIVLCRALVSKRRVWISALVAHRPYLHLLGAAPQQGAALRLAFIARAGSCIARLAGAPKCQRRGSCPVLGQWRGTCR